MKPKIWLLAVGSVFLTLASQVGANETLGSDAQPKSVQVVKQFIQGFNNHSVEQLLQHTTPNVHWFNLSGTKMDIETSTQQELGAAMTDYFASLTDAKASLRQILVSANYVSTVEEVTWSHEGELHSQCSLGIYQLAGDKINAVWFYPSHVCDETPWVEVTSPEIVQPEIGLLKETRQ
ncbi:nuclear transport factor 2 family protein [Shewanella sp. Isolate13]|uniref:nuclear transport factor 2 family protein n=1 Tax=Shewanella sp. Isolate13 TaxID=2908531 RepID=UPI001EFDE0C7|nr:nuclear transport factor 2 family protein [Shewanella sp. Isolate13]MCG9730723.1 nuclear transport factor 2 family protein [Shewanella sp. Isolate13]